MLLSCGAKKSDSTTAVLTGECPKDGNCTIRLFKNKGMVVKNDTFGRPFYELEDNPSKNTYLYTYSRIVKGNIQDAGYREEIVFELRNDQVMAPISNESLQRTKMLFGRFCFCKGQTGYYKITKGNLAVANDSKSETVALNFETTEVPQIIKSIALLIK